MKVDTTDRCCAERVEEKLDLIGGGGSFRDVVRETSLAGNVLVTSLGIGMGALYIRFAMDTTGVIGAALLLGLAVLFVALGLAAADRLGCVLTERWTCQDCRAELERWSDDADVDVDELEGAH